MKGAKRVRLTPAVPLIITILMLANGAGAVMGATAQGTPATFAGSASTLSINSPMTSLTFGGTGPLSPTGGWVNAPMSEVQTTLASAEMLTSVAMGQVQQAESEAAVGSLVLLPDSAYQIKADFAMSRAFSTCSSAWGDAEIANLQVAGNPIQVTGAPNQVVDVFGVATLTIDEQTRTSNGITVNALDLSTVDGVQVIVDSTYSAISCPTSNGVGLSNPPAASLRFNPMFGVPITSASCLDFTSGGGWIPSASISGGKATFGFSAGYKQGGISPTGEVEYHDHADGQFNVHSLDVLYYGCGIDANSRGFGGDAELNHVSGYCYEVFIHDNGEPGRGVDEFSIFLWPPGTQCPTSPPTEAAGQYSNDNVLGGGNIEIHP